MMNNSNQTGKSGEPQDARRQEKFDRSVQDSTRGSNFSDNNADSGSPDFRSLINQDRIMLFMKGDKYLPRCGFSAKVLEILNFHGANYTTFDILADEEVRQGLKEFSNWPTYPQLYINGELIGGCDIICEMDAAGELAPLL